MSVLWATGGSGPSLGPQWEGGSSIKIDTIGDHHDPKWGGRNGSVNRGLDRGSKVLKRREREGGVDGPPG